MRDFQKKKKNEGLPYGPGVKNPPANAGDTVGSLVEVDPTCHRATKPLQNY